jgi:gamma-glutamyltranspeptidase
MVLQTFFSQQYKVGDTLKRTQLAATLKELLKMVGILSGETAQKLLLF